MMALVHSMDQTALSAEQLAEQCRHGCPDAFEALVERYEKPLFHFLFQHTGNRHDAEDLTQETFLKAFQNIHRFDARYRFVTWLFTIGKRAAASHYRAAQSKRLLLAKEEIDPNDPAALLERKDYDRSVWELARSLKPKQYESLWLRYGEGFSVAEVARIMGTTQIHVKVLLHRARRQLSKRLAHREPHAG